MRLGWPGMAGIARTPCLRWESASIFYTAHYVWGYEAVQSLLDRALPDEERQEIIDIVTSWPGVNGAHDLRTRQSGPTRFIQIHLEMEDNLPLVQAHLVAEQVEQAILRRFPGSDVIIHQDPCSVVPREGKRFELS